MTCFQTLEETQISEILQIKGTVLLFKHSNRCSISSTALNRVTSFCKELTKEIPSYIIDVIGQRDMSQLVAKELEVIHQSPQVILLKDGKAVYHKSHFSINTTELVSEINKFNILA